MPTLARGDAERLLRFVAVAEELATEEPFTPETLVELGRLIEADWIGYSELDRVRRHTVEAAGRPGDVRGGISQELIWELLEDHPISLRHQHGYMGALKLSDFLTRRELLRSRLWTEWYVLFGVDHVLNVPIPAPPGRTRTFLLDRIGRDFSERDRLVLDLLRPHLARIWRASQTRRLLAAAVTALGGSSEQDRRGAILLEAVGTAEFVSPPARRLLYEFFGVEEGELPTAVSAWIERGDGAAFTARSGLRTLRIDRLGDALLLQESTEDVGLTPREQEVLSWVARGKTNAQVAEVLRLSPGTVRKHLENAFAKLGVRTRTAAVARFLALVDANEDEPVPRAAPS